jgi:hypothetical protein
MRGPVVRATVTVATYEKLGVSSDGKVYAQATRRGAGTAWRRSMSFGRQW